MLIVLGVGARIAYIPVERFRNRTISGLRDPIQVDLDGTDGKTIEGDGYRVDLRYLAEYDIIGMVVKARRYDRFKKDAPTAWDKATPVDFGIVYGYAAEHRDALKFEGGPRALNFGLKSGDYARTVEWGRLTSSITNNHIMTEDKAMRKKLDKVREGEVVRIKGYLVEGEAYDTKVGNGYAETFRSSLTRTDMISNRLAAKTTCEIIYITDLEIIEKAPY